MKALVKVSKEAGRLEVRDVERPQITPDQVLVEVKAAGICGSDVKHYQGVTKIKPPIVLGHEFSGRIVEVGENARHWSVGARIISETSAYVCGHCRYCSTGDFYSCPERKGYGGVKGVDGVFTKYVAVPARLLHEIPVALSYDEAAVVQPCADIVNAVTRKAKIFAGDTVAVLGPGPMGLLTTQVAKAQGAGRVIQTGHRGLRLKIAEEVGADVVIPVEEEDPVKGIDELTDGVGVDVVFVVVSAASAATQAFDMVRKQGQVTFIAVPSQPVRFDFNKLFRKELVVRGSIMSKWIDYERAINLISTGQVRVKPLITHKLPITQWKQAFDAILERKDAAKIIFTPV